MTQSQLGVDSKWILLHDNTRFSLEFLKYACSMFRCSLFINYMKGLLAKNKLILDQIKSVARWQVELLKAGLPYVSNSKI